MLAQISVASCMMSLTAHAMRLSTEGGSIHNTDADDLTPQQPTEESTPIDTGHTCLTSQERNKAALPDFYEIYNGSERWSDPDFKPDSTALYWEDMEEGPGTGWVATNAEAYITWLRAPDVYSKVSLFGENGIQAEDVEQGYLGDCWFLAAASANAEIPRRVERQFLNTKNELSPNGIYGVNLYTLGVPHTVIVDDWLPLRVLKDGVTITTLFAKVSDDQALWVTILEKALAKYHGNYEHLVFGNAGIAARTLTGAPYESVYHKTSDASSFDIAVLWLQIDAHDKKNSIIMGDTHTSASLLDLKEVGLWFAHTYVVLGTHVLSTGVRLLKMRNPHGFDSYKGPWSDESQDWLSIPEAEREAVREIASDGQFFIPVEDYYKYFHDTNFIVDNSDWSSAYFLQLDDDTAAQRPGSYTWCGAKCTRHTLHLKSSVTQHVYIAAHTWDPRCQADICHKDDAMPHTIQISYRTAKFRSGATQFDPILLYANHETEIVTEWNFTDADMAKDWSVVAWAKTGTLTFRHSEEGVKSKDFPLIDRVQQ